MPTREEIYAAIRSADAAGDGQAVARLGQYLQSMDAPTPTQAPIKIGREGLGDALKQVVSEAGPLGSFLSQAGKTLRNTGEALGIVDKSPEWEALQAANREVNPASSLAGDVVGTAGQAYLGGRALKAGGNAVAALGKGRAIPGVVANAMKYTGQGLTTPQSALQAATGGALFGAATTPGDLGDRAAAAMLGAAGGALGQKAGDVVQKTMARRAAAKMASPVTQRQEAVQAALDAGYTLPPTEIKPTAMNEVLEGLSGKIKTAQAASTKNQSITDALARAELGIAEGAPLSREALQGIERKAGQAYEAIRGFGPIQADDAYQQGLKGIFDKFQGASKDFPGLARPEVANLVDSLNQPQFGSDSAIDAIRVLRESADKFYRSGDTGIAKAYKQAAGELEALVGRNLEAAGSDMLPAFQAARQTIAKSKTVGKALNDQTGEVSAQVLARELKKGKPLSGNLRKIAEVAEAFPRATQSLKEPYRALSPLDFMTGALGGTATGNPFMLAAIGARPAARSAMLSPMYQRMAARPETVGLLNQLLANPASPAFGGLLGSASGLQLAR